MQVGRAISLLVNFLAGRLEPVSPERDRTVRKRILPRPLVDGLAERHQGIDGAGQGQGQLVPNVGGQLGGWEIPTSCPSPAPGWGTAVRAFHRQVARRTGTPGRPVERAAAATRPGRRRGQPTANRRRVGVALRPRLGRSVPSLPGPEKAAARDFGSWGDSSPAAWRILMWTILPDRAGARARFVGSTGPRPPTLDFTDRLPAQASSPDRRSRGLRARRRRHDPHGGRGGVDGPGPVPCFS